MRNASKILGIVGGSIIMLIAVLIVVVGICAVTFADTFMNDFFSSEFYNNVVEYENIETYGFEEMFFEDGMYGLTMFFGTIVIIVGVVFAIFATLGIVGGAVAQRSPVVAAIFMFVSGIVSLVTVIGILPGFMLILGGVFALVKDNKVIQTQTPKIEEA